jgi:integrase
VARPTSHLQWHGKQYRVRLRVPADVRGIIGKPVLIAPLHTADLKVANELKWPIIADLKAQITAARKAVQTGRPYEAEAITHRARHQESDPEAIEAVNTRMDEIEETFGIRAAVHYAHVARGLATPLGEHQEAFLAHKTSYRMKTRGDFLRVLEWLREWLEKNHSGPYLELLDRKTAGQFLDGFLLQGRSRDKAAAYLGFLREYWKWMKQRGHVEENPWLDQDLPQARKPRRDMEPDGGKRAFTEGELKTLLQGDAGPMLGDLMRIAALSGMRLEEICQLQVADCQDGSFRVWAGKTDAARRTVPIHSGLRAIIEKRTKDKKPADFLIDELPPLTNSRETRSDPAAKRFTRYRRSVGVDERPNDKAKSNVDFHSFRRWFVRQARNARLEGATGYDEWTLTAVIGHTDTDRPKSLDLSQAGYAGQDPEKAKRALVEAVKLPTIRPTAD